MMYKTRPMQRAACLLLLFVSWCVLIQAETPPQASGMSARIAGLQKKDGFFPYYWDDKKGEFLLELSPAFLDREFLYFTALGSGIGSTEMFADLSSFGASALCRLRR